MHEDLRLPQFAWREGYGAFTVSRSNVATVRNLLARQEEHHRKRSFQEEYLDLLKKHDIEFEERFLW
ncbi:MAG TPA: transposase [Thermoanaerobaculia bacterium]|nr:transposase [Thermoanaerobaculia bacterium]